MAGDFLVDIKIGYWSIWVLRGVWVSLFWLREFGNGVDCERPIAYLSLDAPVAVFDRLYANVLFRRPNYLSTLRHQESAAMFEHPNRSHDSCRERRRQALWVVQSFSRMITHLTSSGEGYIRGLNPPCATSILPFSRVATCSLHLTRWGLQAKKSIN